MKVIKYPNILIISFQVQGFIAGDAPTSFGKEPKVPFDFLKFSTVSSHKFIIKVKFEIHCSSKVWLNGSCKTSFGQRFILNMQKNPDDPYVIGISYSRY
nr:hypothetical protein [Paenibacillus sp. PL91]